MNRCIDKFPTAFKSNQTPYISDNFHKITEKYCKNYNRTVADIKSAKVIVIGNVAVGKTCLINSFCRQLFNSNYKTTIGVDFEIEQFTIMGVPFNMQIWDTAGQERFKCIAQSYYRFAQAIVIVFDISKIHTLQTCKTWLQEALQSSIENPYIFLVGAKKDLVSSVTCKEIEMSAMEVANEMKAEYWTVCAKKEENVKQLFFRIAALTFDSIMSKEEQSRNIYISNNDIISLKKSKKEEKFTKTRCCNI